MEKAGKTISQIQAKISEISDLKTQQVSNKTNYYQAVEEYKKAVEACNTALKGLVGNNSETTLAGLKQAVDNAYKKVKDNIGKNEDYYIQLEGLKTEVSGISIDGEHKLTVSGSFDRKYFSSRLTRYTISFLIMFKLVVILLLHLISHNKY